MKIFDYVNGAPPDLMVLLEKFEEPSSTFNFQDEGGEKTVIGHVVSLTEPERLRLIDFIKIAIS